MAADEVVHHVDQHLERKDVGTSASATTHPSFNIDGLPDNGPSGMALRAVPVVAMSGVAIAGVAAASEVVVLFSASGTGGAAAITSGLATLGGSMMGGITVLSLVGGALGVGVIATLVRNERADVRNTVMAASAVGAVVGTGLSLGLVIGLAASGTTGAAVVTSGLAVLGCGAMAGGIAASAGIGLGVAVLFGLVAWAVWWYFGGTGQSDKDDPANPEFLSALSSKVKSVVFHHEGELHFTRFWSSEWKVLVPDGTCVVNAPARHVATGGTVQLQCLLSSDVDLLDTDVVVKGLHDFGPYPGWKSCAKCAAWILNRGCRGCRARFCSGCFQHHSCHLALPVLREPYSIEAEVQLTQHSPGTIVRYGQACTNVLRFGYDQTLHNNSLSVTLQQPLDDHQWHHIAATWDGMQRKLFVDYVEVGCETPEEGHAHHADSSDNLRFGASAENQNFEGKIRNLSVKNYASRPDENRPGSNSSQACDMCGASAFVCRTSLRSCASLCAACRRGEPLDLVQTTLVEGSMKLEVLPESLTCAESFLRYGWRVVLKGIHTQFVHKDSNTPWYSFWNWRGKDRIRNCLRLFASQLLLCHFDECRVSFAELESLVEEQLSDKGKKQFGVPYGRLLCDSISGIRRQFADTSRSRKLCFALEFFELPPNPSNRSIQTAHRRLSLRYHPDRQRADDVRALAHDLQSYVNHAKQELLADGLQDSGETLALPDGSSIDRAESQLRQDDAESLTPLEWMAKIYGACVSVKLAVIGISQELQWLDEIRHKRYVHERLSAVATDDLHPSDSVSNFAEHEGADRSIASVTQSASTDSSSTSLAFMSNLDGQHCFLGNTLLRTVNQHYAFVCELQEGAELLASNGASIRVANVIAHTGEHELVRLEAGDASLTVTASHRVQAIRRGRSTPQPVTADRIQIGDEVAVLYSDQRRIEVRGMEGIRTITGRSTWNEVCMVFQVRFYPDLPVAGILAPPGAILSRGSALEGGRRSRIPRTMNHPGHTLISSDAVSIPDTEWSFR